MFGGRKTIERSNPGLLKLEVYVFRLMEDVGDLFVVLESYYLQQRESKRHKFNNVKVWERCDQRKNTIDGNVDIPQDVIEDVVEEYRKSIQFRPYKKI